MNDTTTKTTRRPTRQLLDKIPNYPGLYRHSVNKTYYGLKKVAGKCKDHSLGTTDRKVAERRFKEWVSNLDKIDSEVEKTTLNELIEKFLKTRQGKADKTKRTEQWLVKKLRDEWEHGLDIQVSRIRQSHLDEWLAKQERGMKNSSYNRVGLFLRQLFELAENDRIIAESPFKRVQKGWKRPEKPLRRVPTDDQFRAIIECIRAEQQNVNAEESANFVEFLGLAGLGQAEAESLTWGDVLWDKNQLSVRRRKTKELFFPPIYPRLRPFLERLYASHEVPPERNQRIFKIKDARKALTNACSRLKLPHFNQRAIRAYLIRQLWQAGIDVKLISKWQGHVDGGKLILSTYTEVFGGNDQDYVNAQLSKLIPVKSPAPAAAGLNGASAGSAPSVSSESEPQTEGADSGGAVPLNN
jgi:integrase